MIDVSVSLKLKGHEYAHGRFRALSVEIPLNAPTFAARIVFSIDGKRQSGWLIMDKGKRVFITNIGDFFDFRQDQEIQNLNADAAAVAPAVATAIAHGFDVARRELFGV